MVVLCFIIHVDSRDWHLMWGIGVFCCGIIATKRQNWWEDEVPAAVYTKLKQGIHISVGLTLNFQAENYLSYSALLIVKFFICCTNKVNGWFDSLVWLLLWQKDWWKWCFSFQTDIASMLDKAIEYIKYLALQRCKVEQLGMVHQSSSKGISMIFCPSLPHVSLSVQLFSQSRKTFSSSKLQ
jgi:hypothetical protein